VLSCPVFASSHFRITSCPSTAVRGCPSNSHGINLFADPHPLNPVASIFYKNIGVGATASLACGACPDPVGALRGEGAPATSAARNAQNPVAHPPFFSTTCAMPLAQLLSFDNIPFSWGVGGGLTVQSPYPLFPAPYPLSFHILGHSFALFCTRAKLNPFIFKRFRTLRAKHRGWGVGFH